MKDIAANLKQIKDELPASCTLVAVSKTKPAADIMTAYSQNHRDFGENKVQELTQKAEELPKDIRWHMIGHLQSNKVKYIAPFVYLIHGVDSLKLLREINKQGQKLNRVINCLLQIHIASEDNKFGFDEADLMEIIKSEEIKGLSFIKITGLMGMATLTKDENKIRQEFKSLKRLFEAFKAFQSENFVMQTLSTGMSGDYKIALEENSNMVRVGSAIFGKRDY
ncbi:MAG: YggS family pyridoxal phosphate-dependent enzyme [Ekhidna sp.]|nr:YggS family pyridoxal phosphate-dependent enzyme [Ekhidna sp.]MBC6411012.1 YggS family pyridoxal phosphate-dependent enzyme [Ekhidna sp.]